MNINIDIGQILIGLGVLFTAWQSYRNSRDIKEVHIATNSMKDALVDVTEKESYARGVKAGETSSMNINHREER